MSAANNLGKAVSAYLRSAAHQPVAWQEWGPEAFARARDEDKPILLDVGAAWCHWCHVMDRESYEDEAIAARLNARFVCVKVDRDERPDVDERYQKAMQALTGQGGWPLTAFLLPDGRPFYGGTYFPPTDRMGRPSFGRVLDLVHASYQNKREEVMSNVTQIETQLNAQARAAAAPATAARQPSGDEAPADAAAAGEAQWRALRRDVRLQADQAFDRAHAGWGRAPKFPHPATHQLLLTLASAGDQGAGDLVRHTLAAMRAGGIYDQLVGGFHRYSVDERWLVPHFEKMLYDNAALLSDYARAGRVLDEPAFVATAREIAAWLDDTLSRDDGAFGASQDADINLEDDGDHYTWTLAELQAAIGETAMAAATAAHLGVSAQGHMAHDRSRCVLHLAAQPEDDKLVSEGVARLRAARLARQPAPFVDLTAYTNWNALAIRAYYALGAATGEVSYDERATRALELFIAKAYSPERGFRRGLDISADGWLDDNAQMLAALLDAHLASGESRWLAYARQTADVILDHFAHPAGGLAERAQWRHEEALGQADRPLQDAPSASASGVALLALQRLGHACDEACYHEAVEAALSAIAPVVAPLGLFAATLHEVAWRHANPAPLIVVRADAATTMRALVRHEGPSDAVLLLQGDAAAPSEAGAYQGAGALVCVGSRCLAPAVNVDELRERLQQARATAP